MEHSILIANRGEIAIRIARACADLGIRSTAVYSRDDAASLHVRRADQSVALEGSGAAAYLDIPGIVAAAREAGCTAIHPGYGFLSENAQFAQACIDAGLIFIGPTPDVLRLFGNKASARRAAEECEVPVLAGTPGAVDVEEARRFLLSLDGRGMLLKATAGGGGRGMRTVLHEAQLEEAHARASAEALAAFGCADVYCEELISDARHIEVQVLGDGHGKVVHFGERECSLQRRRQKLIEIAPSPSLDDATREGILAATLRMARKARYRGLGTFEFLVDRADPGRFVFIETNPRLQVEHTVTEATHGVDLVQAQIRVCLGLEDSGQLFTKAASASKGYAIQLRLNMESMQSDGGVIPTSGRITAYEVPSGPGVRVDGFGYRGYATNTRFDSLLAKLIVHTPRADYRAAVRLARRALGEFHIDGVQTNACFLAAVLDSPAVESNDVSTTWIDEHIADLVAAARDHVLSREHAAGQDDSVSQHGGASGPMAAPAGTVAIAAPLQAAVVSLLVKPGEQVRAGQTVAVLEAMKMQHSVDAAVSGIVHSVATEEGSVLEQHAPIVFIEPSESTGIEQAVEKAIDLDAIRPDLAAVLAAHALTADDARPEAVAKRHKMGYRTARENIEALVDSGSFVEYGALAIAAQRGRRPVDELRRTTPADGIVTGLATVNADAFGKEAASTVIAAYDYTVLAGTQGYFNHKKQDRIFELADEMQRPMVLFAEGGGGRPGDTDKALTKVASLDIPTFKSFARLSGRVPVVGVANGRCFAGNAALLGCCDTIIATQSSNIGLGGPAMIEGGGLGVYTPEEIGPSAVQCANGVIDVLVADEAEATQTVRRYLSYFQGPLAEWTCADQRLLRHCVPENRVRAYDVRKVIETMADTGSVLELRRHFAPAMVTALIRIEGRPIGLMANNPMHLGGAIDAEAGDKAARFIALCDAHGLPLLSLCDTPGFMVGPQAETTAQVRRVSRMFVNTASLSVPIVMVVLRKGYGLGALAMAGGNFQDTTLSVSWPTGEFGGMGLEGAVRLGFKRELEAIADPQQREAEYQRRVAEAYEHGKATNMASLLEIDDVIDPARTRDVVTTALRAAERIRARRPGQVRSHIETW